MQTTRCQTPASVILCRVELSGLSRFLVQGPVENFTQNWTIESLVFYRHFSSSMTQHLATFNKILFTKGVFFGTKCTKIVFGRDSAWTTLGELQATMLRQTP